MISRKAALFVLLTYLLSWPLAFGFFRLGGSIASPQFIFVGVAYMFTPAASATVVQKLIYRQPLRNLGISYELNRWFLVAWFLPLVLVFAAIGLSALMPGAALSSGLPTLIAELEAALAPEDVGPVVEKLKDLGPNLPVVLVTAMVAGALLAGPTINAVAALGEELGWRGLLQQELQPFGFWVDSVVVGVIWGLWHLPLVLHGHNYPQHPVLGVFFMTLFTVLLSPVLAYLRVRGGSVLAPAVAHGVLNAAGGAVLFVTGGSDLTVGITGAAGFIVLLLVNTVLSLHMCRRTIEFLICVK